MPESWVLGVELPASSGVGEGGGRALLSPGLTHCPHATRRGRKSLHSEASPARFPISAPGWQPPGDLCRRHSREGAQPNVSCSTLGPRVRGGAGRGLGVPFKACVERQAGSPTGQSAQPYSGTSKPTFPTPLSQAELPVPSLHPDFSLHPKSRPSPKAPGKRPLPKA